MNSIQERYHTALNNIPSPGSGCHTSLLSVANYGVKAGIPPQTVQDDIRMHIPRGIRHIPDREIINAINKALADHDHGILIPKTRPAPIVGNSQAALRCIISQGKHSSDADLWESSPIRLLDEPCKDSAIFIETLFDPSNLVWVGDRHEPGILEHNIRRAGDWAVFFRAGGKTSPFIIINPLSGYPAEKKSGGETYRGDHNVKVFPHCLVEFDQLTREDQIRFWSAVKLPIRALIDSGGKSIHAWLDVQKLVTIQTSEEWKTGIKERLYDSLLTPMGVDAACSNPARLSRLPGHPRAEKNTWQKLLWLSPDGRPIE